MNGKTPKKGLQGTAVLFLVLSGSQRFSFGNNELSHTLELKGSTVKCFETDPPNYEVSSVEKWVLSTVFIKISLFYTPFIIFELFYDYKLMNTDNANDSCPEKCTLCPAELRLASDLWILTHFSPVKLISSSIPGCLYVSAFGFSFEPTDCNVVLIPSLVELNKIFDMCSFYMCMKGMIAPLKNLSFNKICMFFCMCARLQFFFKLKVKCKRAGKGTVSSI